MGTIYRCFVQLAFLNSVINPFIYAFTNSNFRNGLRHLLLCSPDVKLNHSSGTVGTASLAVSSGRIVKVSPRYSAEATDGNKNPVASV